MTLASRNVPSTPLQDAREFRVTVGGLEPGMFVSRLDRPWLGTEFPLEGALVRTRAEVEAIARICRHVYVDAARGASPELRFVQFDSQLVQHAGGQDEVDALRRTYWNISSDFNSEIGHARDAHERLQHDIKAVMTDVRAGSGVNASALTDGVDAMIDSITRNPAALPWVLELRRKGDYVYQHALGCAVWAATFGRHLGMEREDLRDLAVGALLCDVGKVRFERNLLEDPQPLSNDNFHVMRSHVAESCRIVRETAGLSPVVLEMVMHHHERHDGSGYPRGLCGSAIPMHARIAGLIDTFDAMTSVRAYAPSKSPHEAVMTLYETRDRLFQAELVEQFIRTCGVYPTGSLVELSDRTVGVVMAVNSLKRLRPAVMLLLDRDKRPLARFRTVDLSETDVDAQGNPLTVVSSLAPDAYGLDRSLLFLD